MRTVRRLDVWSLEGVIGDWEGSFPRPLIDLSQCQVIDPFAVAFLVLYVRRCAEAGGRARILLPKRGDVLHYLGKIGFFRWVGKGVWTDRPSPEAGAQGGNALTAMVRVVSEGEVQGLVDGVCDALHERFPLGERSIKVLAMSMLELLQNISHHANPLREDLDPYGLAAVQEYADYIHLVVMDKGVGLQRSLALNPCYRGLKEHEALEAVLIQGASRLADPGRGGALRRIREVVLRNEGRLLVRSGGGAFWQAEVEWGIEEVHPFPGVQVSIQLPRALFFG